MGAVEVISDDWMGTGEFFAPAASDLVSGLMGEYRRARGWIDEASAFFEGDAFRAVIGYFLDGNSDERRGRGMMASSAAQMFGKEGAVAALDAAYWAKAMALTDVYDAMPQKRREEWNEAIRGHKTPAFEEETVRATLEDLLLSRSKFFAERVDGIFRALSGEHVTNAPQGFGKRMILTGITSTYYAHERVGYINDLRAVIARFMGRGEPGHGASHNVVMQARNLRGQWLLIDGGALRLRCYLNGNAHLEVHPDMAWRLNCVLAQMHPAAIPAQFRQRPKKRPKEFAMIQRPLPFAVLAQLERVEPAYRYVEDTRAWSGKGREAIPNAVSFGYSGDFDKHARNEAEAVLASLGGVLTKERNWQFDYDPLPVIKEITSSGCVPDQKSHQFYPTPEWLAQKAVELAEIEEGHECLEPSAGTGSIADLMPKAGTNCVEISALHCAILEAKGHVVVQGDFLKVALQCKPYHRIVMNPPFDQGRWRAHLEHAASLLRDDGRLVAILPESARRADVLPGWRCAWHGPFSNAFPGASVSVVVLVAERG